MSDTNPLFDQKEIQAGLVKMVLRSTAIEGKDVYQVFVTFPLDGLRVYASKWANPLRVALEAADEALNELKCEVYNQELNGGKPYEKPAPFMVIDPAAKAEEKKDG